MYERVGVAEWRGKDQVPYILKSVSGPNLVSICSTYSSYLIWKPD